MAKKNRGFRFEEMWLESPECKDVMKEAWNELNHQGGNRPLWSKLGECRKGLISWSKARFGNSMMRKTRDQLRELGAGKPTSFNQAEEITVWNGIRDLWEKEELFWNQRARVIAHERR